MGWGVLRKTNERGVSSAAAKITVPDGDGVGPLEAAISNSERQAQPFRSMVGAPCMTLAKGNRPEPRGG